MGEGVTGCCETSAILRRNRFTPVYVLACVSVCRLSLGFSLALTRSERRALWLVCFRCVRVLFWSHAYTPPKHLAC